MKSCSWRCCFCFDATARLLLLQLLLLLPLLLLLVIVFLLVLLLLLLLLQLQLLMSGRRASTPAAARARLLLLFRPDSAADLGQDSAAVLLGLLLGAPQLLHHQRALPHVCRVTMSVSVCDPGERACRGSGASQDSKQNRRAGIQD